MEIDEFKAGPDQTIVLYRPPDTGLEVDHVQLYGAIADDARVRAAAGYRIVSMTALPAREGGVAFGLQGSGFQTKISVAALYEGPYPSTASAGSTTGTGPGA